MIPDERSRKLLYDGVVEVLGAERADILMAYLPAVEWTALATKQDLLPLQHDIVMVQQDIVMVKRDISEMKRDVDHELTLLRAEMNALGAGLRTELQKQFVTQTWRLAGLIVALNALTIAAFSLR